MRVVGIVIILIVGGLIYQNFMKTSDTIKIGGLLSLTGAASSWGEAAQNGINLAVEDVNNAGGVLGKNLEVVYEDDQSNPVQTVTSFKKLTEVDGIKFIIGLSWTKFGLAIKDLVNDEIVISPSLGGSAFNENNNYIFNTRQHDYILSRNLAEYVYSKGYRSAAILSVNDPYNKEQANEFKRVFENLGGTVKYLFEPVIDQKDVRSDLLKVKADSNVDVLIATTGATPLTSIFAIQMKELKMNYTVYSVTIDKTRIDESKGACDGWIYFSSFTPSKEFSERYAAVYGKSVQIASDSAYDAVMMLSQAIKDAKSTEPLEVQKYLNDIKSYQGVSGSLVSDDQGAFTKNYKILRVENGTSIEVV